MLTTEQLTPPNAFLHRLQQLQAAFPEIFTEGKIDMEKFKAIFTNDINFNNERYILNWAGKSDAFKVLQIPSTATLKPQPDESVNFDSTENVFIEGENLEVLKVLQKSYYGKIKCIIIDPPYNTGNDSFIYPDSFKENKEDYQKRIGEKDEEGYLMKEGMFRKNSKDSGHYHSNWLSMMYPRLFLAKNLLREDGVIFVHIDDNEVHNLRMMMNEIFGEENFEGHIHWRRRHNQPNDKTKMIGIVAEHILSFAKNKDAYKKAGVGKIDLTGDFSNPDNDERGDWASKPWKVGSDQSGSRYKIISPSGKEFEEEWMGDLDSFKVLLKDKRIFFPKNGDGLPRKKYYRFERLEEGQCATNWWSHSEFGHNQGANDDMTSLFGVKNIFDNPKPKEIVRGLIQISNVKGNDIILDFFAGSGTTAHATLELNAEDNGSRKFILVQLPEVIEEKEEAFKLGYRHISEVSRERIRKAILKIQEQNSSLFKQLKIDLGFKSFKLSPSNFKIWRGSEINEENLVQQLDAFTNPVREGSEKENMLYELMLKAGYSLTEKVEGINILWDGDECGGQCSYYKIAGGALIIALQSIDEFTVEGILAEKPQKVITLDILFKNNDQLKTNTVLQMKDAGVDFKTI
ncbi:MAG TPA: site-specific DNA-methyltransferase [Ferruginibacter sp.]|nr:site-specific DNA-methyltransferase [Ferruginibacter sp.]HMP20993.1 site-specific DNA-methyltransferase [Ferruginibacter sp.]